eukprot:2351720-Prymnesium_polylepis.1
MHDGVRACVPNSRRDLYTRKRPHMGTLSSAVARVPEARSRRGGGGAARAGTRRHRRLTACPWRRLTASPHCGSSPTRAASRAAASCTSHASSGA